MDDVSGPVGFFCGLTVGNRL
jgi:hypothetical protein